MFFRSSLRSRAGECAGAGTQSPRPRNLLSEAAANRDLSEPYGIETGQMIGYGSPAVGPGLGGSRIFREMSLRVILKVAGLLLLAGLLAIPAGGALASFPGAEGRVIFASGG